MLEQGVQEIWFTSVSASIENATTCTYSVDHVEIKHIFKSKFVSSSSIRFQRRLDDP